MSAGPRQGAIDGLRGIAALAVVMFHYAGHARRYFDDFPFEFPLGRHGVELFFVISGYFIFATVEKTRGPAAFLYQRFSRLYPAYWATLALLLAHDLLTATAPWWTAYAANATMLQSFFGRPDIDIVFWSLGTELAFYGLMALLVASGGIRWPVAVGAAWLLAGAVAQLTGFAQRPPGDAFTPWVYLLRFGPFFVGGMMLHLLQTRERRPPRQVKAALAMLPLCVAAAWTGLGMVPGIAALLFFAALRLAATGRLPWLAWPVMTWLGAISYALYLVHRNLGYALMNALHERGLGGMAAVAATLAAALLLASAVTYGIERPGLRLLRRGAERRRGRRLSSAA